MVKVNVSHPILNLDGQIVTRPDQNKNDIPCDVSWVLIEALANPDFAKGGNDKYEAYLLQKTIYRRGEVEFSPSEVVKLKEAVAMPANSFWPGLRPEHLGFIWDLLEGKFA